MTDKQTLLVATRDQLSGRIASLYNSINSFQATINMTPSVGSVYKGQINDFPNVRAVILFRKPADIRIQAQLPVVGSQFMDMVSNADEFRVFLDTKNLFLHGMNSAPATSKNKLEESASRRLSFFPVDPARRTRSGDAGSDGYDR